MENLGKAECTGGIYVRSNAFRMRRHRKRGGFMGDSE